MSTKSILLADDEQNILTSIGWILEKNNFSVTTALNGRKAIELLQENCFDLVITDLIMPDLGGIPVLQQAKRLYPEIGVIILTGHGDVDSAVETMQLGADDYLQKPCDTEDLLRKARRSFERQDMVVRLREQNELLMNEIATRKQIEQQLQQSRDNLEYQVKERTAELTSTVNELQSALTTLLHRDAELQEKNRELSDTNTALNVLMKRREKELHDIRNEMAAKAIESVLPLIKKAAGKSSGTARDYLMTAQANLLDLVAEQQQDGLLATARLAPRELQIVHYIRQNKTSKEMADLLGLSVSTVESYRENIREKLRLKNKNINLRKFLTSRR